MEHTAEKSMTRRDVVVAFRLTPTESAHVDAAGAALKSPRRRADYCRAAALYLARQNVPAPAKPIRLPQRRLPALDTRLLTQILGQLGMVGNNVNQLARRAHRERAAPQETIIKGMAEDVAFVRAAIVAALHGGGEARASP